MLTGRPELAIPPPPPPPAGLERREAEAAAARGSSDSGPSGPPASETTRRKRKRLPLQSTAEGAAPSSPPRPPADDGPEPPEGEPRSEKPPAAGGGRTPREERNARPEAAAEAVAEAEEERNRPDLTAAGTPRKKKGECKKYERRLQGRLKEVYDELAKSKDGQARADERVAAAERALEDASRALDAAREEAEVAGRGVDEADSRVLAAELAEDTDWTRNYRKLVAFRDQHGHTNVPSEEKSLNKWCTRQRLNYKNYKKGESFPLKPMEYYIKALDELGFEWVDPKNPEAVWQRQLDKLLAFQLENGHCCVPKGYRPDMSLGAWVHRQRYFYRLFHEGRPTQMTQERIDLLNSFGFQWSRDASNPPDDGDGLEAAPPRLNYRARTAEDDWNLHYEVLKDFHARHGHVRFRKEGDLAVEYFYSLRDWAAWQRRQYRLWKEGKPSAMTEERVGLLEELGFEWVRDRRRDVNGSTAAGKGDDAAAAATVGVGGTFDDGGATVEGE